MKQRANFTPPRKAHNVRNIKILQLGKFFPLRGGVEKVMYSLMVGLLERGEHCDMLCAAYSGRGRRVKIDNTNQSFGNLGQSIGKSNQTIGETGQTIGGSDQTTGKTRQAGAKSIRPKRGQASIICTRTWMKLCGTMLSPRMIWTARRIGRRYDLIHVHHPDPMACLALFTSGYKGKVILHWHADIVKQRRILKLYRPLQQWLISRADLIIGTSPTYLASSPYLRAVQHKTACLPIGVDAMEPDKQQVEALRRRYKGKKIIFSLGRMVPYKGFEYLIRSADYLDDSYVILIGGEGPLRNQLKNEIRMCGLQGRVELIGFVSDGDLPAYFGACTLFCLPSVEKTEAYGIVQIEAMSCSKPVVATRIEGSGVSWVNKHGVSGLNVESRNAMALADAIHAITKDTATYQTYCHNARERYLDVFTRQRMTTDYHNLLTKCLAK